MSISQITNKKIAFFTLNNPDRLFINFLLNNNINVIMLDNIKNDFNIEKKDLLLFQNREEINWGNLECLIIEEYDKNLIEISQKNNCSVYSPIEFFMKYFSEFDYIGLIGESGSLISSNLLKYLFCKLNLNIDYDICNKENIFSLPELNKTENYIYELTQKTFNILQKPHFNNLIIFDLNYNDIDIEKIKLILLNQTENDLTILNIDDKKVKDLYKKIENDESYITKFIPISINKILTYGVSFIGNEISLNIEDRRDEYITEEFQKLQGKQNKTNILAAISLMIHKKHTLQEIVENLYDFKATDEVFELVIHMDNFTFVNDIKNTNKSQSLISFENIYWILCIDEIEFEFSNFIALIEYFKKIKYIFIIGKYNDEIIKIFKENEIKYFVMYDIKSTFKDLKELIKKEDKEEKITILLSSINNIKENKNYIECSKEFERLANQEKDGE